MQIVNVTETLVSEGAARVSSVNFDRIVHRIVKDHLVTEERARIMLQGAISFLVMCSRYHGKQFTPSRSVDDAWHTFLLYTQAYAVFCASLGARLHHEPNDGPEMHVGGYARTLRFMDDNGIAYDETLWASNAEGDSVADPSTCCSEVDSLGPMVGLN